jgi:hydrogenase nickel incorporation protein HypA/HybF
MHELSIVEALIEQVQQEIDRGGHRGRVSRLHLAIGRLSGVSVDSIRFAFQLLAPGTVVQRAEIHVDQPPAACVCGVCGRRTEIEDLVVQCPACRSDRIHIEGGNELLLQTIDLEECP